MMVVRTLGVIELVTQVNYLISKRLCSISVSINGAVKPPVYTINVQEYENKEALDAGLGTDKASRLHTGLKDETKAFLIGMLKWIQPAEETKSIPAGLIPNASKGELKSIVDTLEHGLNWLTENMDMGDGDDQRVFNDCEKAIEKAKLLLTDTGESESIIKFGTPELRKLFLEYLDCEEDHFIEYMNDSLDTPEDEDIHFQYIDGDVSVSIRQH